MTPSALKKKKKKKKSISNAINTSDNSVVVIDDDDLEDLEDDLEQETNDESFYELSQKRSNELIGDRNNNNNSTIARRRRNNKSEEGEEGEEHSNKNNKNKEELTVMYSAIKMLGEHSPFVNLRKLSIVSCSASSTRTTKEEEELKRHNNNNNNNNRMALPFTELNGQDFQALKKLKELTVSKNAIERLTNLDKLPRTILKLNLSENKLVTLNGLEKLTHTLQVLIVRQNKLRTFQGLGEREDMEEWEIETLDARENDIGNFSDLRLIQELKKLKDLRLRSNTNSSTSSQQVTSSSRLKTIYTTSTGQAVTNKIADAENDDGRNYDGNSNNNNPVCALPSYRMAVNAFVPWLEKLDEISFTANTTTTTIVTPLLEEKEEEGEEEEEETTSTLLSLEDDIDNDTKAALNNNMLQKWNTSVKITEQEQQIEQQQRQKQISPPSKTSTKLMNHILRNKRNVSSTPAAQKDESVQTTTAAVTTTTQRDQNNSVSKSLTSKLEKELFELRKTFETKRRENEMLGGALLEVTNEVKHIDHETSEIYAKSSKLAELSNLNVASANRYKSEVELLKKELKENRKALENALTGEADALEEVNLLKSAIERAREEYSKTMTRMRDDHNIEIRKVSKTVSSLEELEYAAEDEIEHLHDKLREMELDYSKRLEDGADEKNAIARRLEIAFEELKELDSVLASETEARMSSESLAEELKGTNQNLRREINELNEIRKDCEDLKREKKKLEEEFASLRRENAMKEEMIQGQTEKVKRADLDISTATVKEENAKKTEAAMVNMRESLELKTAMLENANALVSSLKEEILKLSKENKTFTIENAKISISLQHQDAEVTRLENELKSERSKRLAFERAHVGSKDEILARDEMLHWANDEVERINITLEETQNENDELSDIIRNVQSDCADYKRIAERALREKEIVEDEMRMLLVSQEERESELLKVKEFFFNSNVLNVTLKNGSSSSNHLR